MNERSKGNCLVVSCFFQKRKSCGTRHQSNERTMACSLPHCETYTIERDSINHECRRNRTFPSQTSFIHPKFGAREFVPSRQARGREIISKVLFNGLQGEKVSAIFIIHSLVSVTIRLRRDPKCLEFVSWPCVPIVAVL